MSDASPLTNLAAIGRLDILRSLYGSVLIPSAVAAELEVGRALGLHIDQINAAEWIEVAAIRDRTALSDLLLELDLGEAEAIVLAAETHADFLLMDERAGRAIAGRRGIRTVGLLGALVVAKHRGVIAAGRPIIESLMSTAKFWIGTELYQSVLREFGE